MDKIGLVTVTYNSANVLQSFIDCFHNQSYENIVLYIVDNSSKDNTLFVLEKTINSKITIIKNQTNLGVAKANNQGITLAIREGCDQILLVNNDVEFEPKLIEKMINVQDKNNCSMVAPKIMYSDSPNKIWYAGGWFEKKKGYLPTHRGIQEKDDGQYDKVIEIEYSPTCCLLVKKKVFHDVGLMNEKYFAYFDDTDFLYRVWKDTRHSVFYCPNVVFNHKVGSLTKSFKEESINKYRGDFFIQMNIRNHVYFLKQVGGGYAYIFIVWLFFKNNIKFLVSSEIKKTFLAWKLINNSYFEGLKM